MVKLSTVILFVSLLTGCTETAIHSTIEVKPQKFYHTRLITELSSSQGLSIVAKKKRFFNFLTPLIVQENKLILAQRKRLIYAINQKNDREWLKMLAKQYQLPSDNDYQELLRRVDILPTELILSQSANESMWGESRFAQQGNNLFGQWCLTPHCGLTPLNRDTTKTHEVAIFKDVNGSIRSYLHNINTNLAYVKLRNIRSRLRLLQRPLIAEKLATGLEKYSERGEDYVLEIQSMIKTNKALMPDNSVFY